MRKLDVNKITIASYDCYIEEYIKKDLSDIKRREAYWPAVDRFLLQLKPGSEIFEIGSAMGRHAKVMEENGFKVIRSDASRSFVNYLLSKGYEAQYFDVLNAELPDKYPAVYAHAVLLHFPLLEFRKALNTIRNGLNPNGLFCFSMKVGDFEGWCDKGLSGKRYFKYWNIKDLTKELKSAEFSITNKFLTEDESFVFVTAEKSH